MLLTAAFVVLLPLLAILQFQWIGQISEAERERLQRTVRASAARFAQDLDEEVTRAYTMLQVDAGTLGSGSWDHYAARYAAWLAATQAPGLVKDVLVADVPTGRPLRLRRWNAATHAFEDAAWPDDLVSWRDRVASDLDTARTGGAITHRAIDEPWSGSMLVAPVVTIVGLLHNAIRPPSLPEAGPVSGYTFIRLDDAFIRRGLLPSLARRHFGSGDTLDFRVGVVDRADGSVIYRSDGLAPTGAGSAADVEVPVFAIRPGQLLLATGPIHADPDSTATGAGRPAQLETERLEAPAPDPGAPVRERSLVVSVFSRKLPGEAIIRTTVLGGDRGRWRLLVQHPAGSLDAAVARARRRNTGVSLGILALMAVSIAMMATAARRAQRLGRQQMEFVAGVSHELRTPVSVISSAAENLADGVVEEPARVRRYGSAIRAEARRLGETVERVLQLAGIESGRAAAARVPVDAAAVVRDALAGASAAALEAGVTVDTEIDAGLPPVLGDAVALRAAVENLVLNAIKYGGEARWLGVEVRCARAARPGWWPPGGRHDEILLTVADRGVGIAAADLPHVFEPFYRGSEAIGRRVQGTGLGLAIVRGIVGAHGGRVTVVSRIGEGSRFTLHLPVTGGAAVPAERATAAAAR